MVSKVDAFLRLSRVVSLSLSFVAPAVSCVTRWSGDECDGDEGMIYRRAGHALALCAGGHGMQGLGGQLQAPQIKLNALSSTALAVSSQPLVSPSQGLDLRSAT